MTPVEEKAPISRPQPARIAISSTKVLPLSSRKSSQRCPPHFLAEKISLITASIIMADSTACGASNHSNAPSKTTHPARAAVLAMLHARGVDH